jgi:hypothetical protein
MYQLIQIKTVREKNEQQRQSILPRAPFLKGPHSLKIERNLYFHISNLLAPTTPLCSVK